MDALIAALYAIPILGIVFELGGYLIATLPAISPLIIQAATPLTLGAMCGVLCERSGVVNIGIEGIMLASAFTGWVVGVIVAPILGGDASAFFGITPALLVAVAAAVLVALLISLLHAWLSITIRADQIISGTIINIAAFGVTGYLNTLIAAGSPTSAGNFVPFHPPSELVNLPVVGWLLDAFLSQGPIAMSMIVIVIVLQVLLFRSRWGLRTRAVGEHPKAAETVGINVIRLRYRNVILSGIFAGLAGAYLSMEATNSFQAGMTVGRGFIALAALIIGRWTPVGAFLAALLFATSDALGQAIVISAPGGALGDVVNAIPAQFYNALPYLVTIVVLAGLIGRSIPPAADGQPYQREAAT
ncbi:MAG TPA: ABC transporter permease [Candidatus Limnocylindrales bacterium]|nr:ABC transporter permease [Candidatus Limnocylindrales bacterium]